MTPLDVDLIRATCGARLHENHPVGQLTTYRVGGAAAFHVLAQSVSDLEAVSHVHRESGTPIVVLGRGSNVLFADEGFPGIAVQLGDFADEIAIGMSGRPERVRAGAAVLLPVLARRTAGAGLTGFEWAVGVPGTVGGAVRMNAGGHGSDVAAHLVVAEVFDLATTNVVERDAASLGLRFRGSSLTETEVVLGAEFALSMGSARTAMSQIEEIVKWRRENQPGGQNAGSVFVNPVAHEVSAGLLIDTCGLRGFRRGSAEVSRKHANFIQVDPDGRARDIVEVMLEVQRVVFEKTGHRLKSEIRLIGFDDAIQRALG